MPWARKPSKKPGKMVTMSKRILTIIKAGRQRSPCRFFARFGKAREIKRNFNRKENSRLQQGRGAGLPPVQIASAERNTPCSISLGRPASPYHHGQRRAFRSESAQRQHASGRRSYNASTSPRAEQ